MALPDPSDVRFSTTVTGYNQMTKVLDTIRELYVPDATHANLPSTVPGWMAVMADELREMELEHEVSVTDATYRLSKDAEWLAEQVVVDVMDDDGVVFGWDAVDWDDDDAICDALRQAMLDSDQPMEFVRLTGMDDFEETHNAAYDEVGEPEYAISVEPRIEIGFPPEKRRPLADVAEVERQEMTA